MWPRRARNELRARRRGMGAVPGRSTQSLARMSTRPRSSNQPWLIGGLISLSAVNAVLGAVATSRGITLSESTEMLWYFVFSIVIGVWLKNDMFERDRSARANYSQLLIFLIWPLLLPIHLVKSRGIEGLVLFVGFLGTYIAPYFAQLVIWTRHAS